MRQKIKSCLAMVMAVSTVVTGIPSSAYAAEIATEISTEDMTEKVTELISGTVEKATEFVAEPDTKATAKAQPWFNEINRATANEPITEEPTDAETAVGLEEVIESETERIVEEVTESETETKIIAEETTESGSEAVTVEATEGETAVYVEGSMESEPEANTVDATEDETQVTPEETKTNTEVIREEVIGTDCKTEVIPKSGDETKSESETSSLPIKVPEKDLKTDSESRKGTIKETVIAISGNGAVQINVNGEVYKTISGDGTQFSLGDLDQKDVSFIMMPADDSLPYRIMMGSEVFANKLWFGTDEETGCYSGMLIVPNEEYTFEFKTEAEIAGTPIPFGDGSLYPGSSNWNLIMNAPRGTDLDNPVKGTVYSCPSTFISRISPTNYFAAQGGYVSVDPNSPIYEKAQKIWMTTCGVGHEYCPSYGDTGTLYMYITDVVVTSASAYYKARFYWINNNNAHQSVYSNAEYGYDIEKGGIQIIKRLSNADYMDSDDYKLNAIFHVYDEEGKYVGRIETNKETGIGTLANLNEGTYTIKEITPPKDVTRSTKVYTATVKIGQTKKVTVTNNPILGHVYVQKVNSAGQWEDSMKGAKFSIYDNESCMGTPVYGPFTVNSGNVLVNYRFDIHKTYWLKEEEAPASGKWSLSGKTVAIKFKSETGRVDTDMFVNFTAKFKETPKMPNPVYVRIYKESSLSAAGFDWINRYGAAYNLANAAYTFYWDAACEESIGTVYTHTISDGTFRSKTLEIPYEDKNLKPGDSVKIYYKETSAPAGHVLNTTVKSKTIKIPTTEEKSKTYDITEKDQYQYGYLGALVTKTGVGGVPLPGAEFTVKYYGIAQGNTTPYETWVFRTNSEGKLDVLNPVQGIPPTSDKSGLTVFPAGSYEMYESKAPVVDGRELKLDSTIHEFDLLVPDNPESGKEYLCKLSKTFVVTNEEHLYIKVKKESANPSVTNGNSLYSLAGAEFGVYFDRACTVPAGIITTKADGTSDPMKITINNENSKYVSSDAYVTVYMKELKAPKGFKLNDDIKSVRIKMYTTGQITFADDIVQHPVKVHKVSAAPNITSGNPLYSFVGAQFQIYESPDCSFGYKGTLTVNSADGMTNEIELPFGTYYVKETKAPTGYKLNEEIKSFSITEQTTTAMVEFKDEPIVQKIGIAVKKESANAKLSPVGAEFTFQYYTSNPATGTPIRTWVLSSDENGDVIFDNRHFVSGDNFFTNSYGDIVLPLGSVIITETKAPAKMKINTDTWWFRITESGITDSTGGNTIENGGIIVKDELEYGGVKINKASVDQGSVPDGDATFEGAVFQIINAEDISVLRKDTGDKEYAPGTEVARITTDAAGFVQIGPILQAGSYIIKEVSAPAGYILGTQEVPFTIEYDGQIVDKTKEPIKNAVAKGGFHFNKSDAFTKATTPNGDSSFAKAQFNVINRSASSVTVKGTTFKPGEVALTIVTDDSGFAQTGKILPVGKYDLIEVTAPEGYEVNAQVIRVVVEADLDKEITDANGLHTWVETPIMGGFTIQKRSIGYDGTNFAHGQGDAGLAGAEFTVANASEKSVYINGKEYIPGAVIMTLTTNEAGFAETGRKVLPYGTYSVTETRAPVGFQIDPTPKTVQITVDDQYDQTGYQVISDESRDFIEDIDRGGFRLQKVDKDTKKREPQGDASLAGAKFTVTNESKYEVFVNGKAYKNGEIVMTLTTNGEGVAETGKNVLPYGTYSVKETANPEGYSVDEFIKTVQIHKDGEYETLDYEWEDLVNRGGFCAAKVDKELMTSGKSQGQAVLENAEFTLWNRSKHEVWVDTDGDGKSEQFAPNTVIHKFYTDKEGKFSTPTDYLPYGTYELAETNPPDGYKQENGDRLGRTFHITSAGQYENFEKLPAANLVYRGDIEILKFRDTLSTEEPGDDVLPLAGVKFHIELAEVQEESHETVELDLVTDENGLATTADPQYPRGRLPYGYYKVTEVTAPEYVDKVEPFYVFVGKDATDNYIDGNTYKGIYKNDKLVETPVKIAKVDAESGSVVSLPGTEWQILDSNMNVVIFHTHYPANKEYTSFVLTADDKGIIQLPEKLPYGTYYLRELHAPYGYLKANDIKFYVTNWGSWLDDEPLLIEGKDDREKGKVVVTKYDSFTKQKIAGAVFEVYANESIVTGDGVTHYKKDQLVTTFTVGEDGIGTSKELDLGKYYLKEKYAPEGYALDIEKHEFELAYADENTPLVYTYMDCYNVPSELYLYKFDADRTSLQGVKFQIERLGDPGSTGIPCKNTIDGGTFVTNKDGEIDVKYLKSGFYSITEIETLPGYVPDSVPKYFTITTQGTIFESDADGKNVQPNVAVTNRLGLSWENEYTRTAFSKKGVTGRDEIPGAEMEIYDAKGNLVYSWTSTDEPHVITRIPAGKYTLVEKTAPKGYVLASSIDFEVLNTGVMQQYEMKDKSVTARKVDANGDPVVVGAKMEVREIEYETGEAHFSRKVIDSWTTSKEEHRIENLVVGHTYVLIEAETPEGWVKAKPIIFAVPDDLHNQDISMTDIRVKANKFDQTLDTYVEGASLEVRTLKGKVVDSWVTDGNFHYISGLEIGESYVLAETKAPAGFVLANPVNFTVEKKEEDQEIVMVNKQVLFYKVNTKVEEIAGAKLEVRDESDHVVDNWVSDGTAHTVSGLKVGKTYTLVEVEAPEGYAIALPIIFTVEDNAKNDKINLINKQVFASKKSVTGEDELTGAHMSVYDAAGEPVDSWVSTEKPHPISGIKVGETYVLHEDLAPLGYVIASDVNFTVMDDQKDQTVVMKDKQVFVSKKAITGCDELPGAKLTVFDKAGNVIDTWISGEAEHAVSGLQVGKTYILKEEAAPDGYVRTEDIKFTVEDDWRVHTVVMKDDYTKVEVSKQDATTGKELPGAKMTLKDENGNVVDEWTSTDEPHLIERLKVGRYVLHEDLAPVGYKTASDVEFEVEETGEVQKVVMKDESIPDTTANDHPKTGDTTNIAMELTLTLLSGAVLLGLFKKRRKDTAK